MTGNEYQKEALRTASGMNYEHHGMLRNSYLKKSKPAHQPVMCENKTNIYFDPAQNRAGSSVLICTEKCYPRGMAT